MQKGKDPSRVTIYDVAKEANVSLATVSRVINGVGNVSKETKELVEQTIEKLGYVPSDLARGLAKQKTTNVAIVLPSPNYSYISSIMAGMIDVCKIYGYNSTLFTYEDPEDAARVVDTVISSRVEGICCFNSELSEEDLKKMMMIQLPMVLIGTDNFGDNALVDINYSSCLAEIIERATKRGVKEFIYLKNPRKDWHMVNEFEKAITKVLKDKPHCQLKFLPISDSYVSIYDYFYQQFKKVPPHNEMYITTRDSLATAIVNAACDLGYRPVKDFEAFGVIGTKQARMSRPTISAIDVDLYEVGSIAMRMLTKMLQGTLNNKFFTFTPEYHARESTKD
ncbi:MAG: LacI family DNA-binding transcriptional regulator [Bacilli bacterium]|jgi:LacI family transcriptional regulator